MAIREQGRLADGLTALSGGMDAGRNPSDIAKTQVAYAENITFRGGFARTRPAFRRIVFPSESADALSMLAARFQGAHYYEESATYRFFIVVAGGSIYKLAPPASGEEWTVTDITNGMTISSTKQRVYMIQADKYLIIQDGTNTPVIWAHDVAARVAASDEVPQGTGPMAYGNGRLWVANGRKFYAGDILGGTTGILKFTENTLLLGGGAFNVSVGSGDITAMRFVTTTNTALGTGELMVYTADGAFAIVVPPDRYDWYSLTDPIQRVVMPNNGSVSHFATLGVNGDQYFRSRDGVRSIKEAVRDWADPGNTPISREMNRVLKYDSQTYMPFMSAVLFDNRLLMTAMSDYDATTGIGFKGLVVLDFDVVSGMREKLPPVWDGFWRMKITRSSTETDFDILQIFTGRFNEIERCMVAVRNESDTLEFWELKADGADLSADTDLEWDSGSSAYDAVDSRITSELETPSFDFGQMGASKELVSADMWVDELSGTVDFHADFHPDQYPCWVSWQDWAVTSQSGPSDCDSLIDYKKQYRPRMRIARPPDTEEPAAGKRFNLGWEFAARLKWKGRARLKLFRLNAIEVVEEPFADVVNQDSTSHGIACNCISGVSTATNE